MKCPKCYDRLLYRRETNVRGVNIDICPKCRGIWFDMNELASVLGDRAEKIEKIPLGAVIQDHSCPKCDGEMHMFCYPDTMTVVDMCESCLGFWLDDKEWKEIYHARSEIKNDFACPKCNFLQPKTDTCWKCGIIYSKYKKH